MSGSHIALLRGINVGGNNKLPMKDLAALFIAAGCADVKTYIQSGNVVFRADSGSVAEIAATITRQIGERFGIRTSLILRRAEELVDVVRDNPFLAQGRPESALHVGFLLDPPSDDAVKALEPVPGSAEEFLVRGQHICFHFPNGAARVKLPDFDRRLRTVTTVRNWRTVLALRDLSCER
jgi:uncharacterized protein (DUF1697 family)